MDWRGCHQLWYISDNKSLGELKLPRDGNKEEKGLNVRIYKEETGPRSGS